MAAPRPTVVLLGEEAGPQPGILLPRPPLTHTTPFPPARPLTSPHTAVHPLRPTLLLKIQDRMMRQHRAKTSRLRRRRRHTRVMGSRAARLQRLEERRLRSSVGMRQRRLVDSRRRRDGGVKRTMNLGMRRGRLVLRGSCGDGEVEVVEE